MAGRESLTFANLLEFLIILHRHKDCLAEASGWKSRYSDPRALVPYE